jgi:hypothetical protein
LATDNDNIENIEKTPDQADQGGKISSRKVKKVVDKREVRVVI